MQIICTLLETDNHASTSSLKFFTSWMLFLTPTNSVKTLIAAAVKIQRMLKEKPVEFFQ